MFEAEEEPPAVGRDVRLDVVNARLVQTRDDLRAGPAAVLEATADDVAQLVLTTMTTEVELLAVGLKVKVPRVLAGVDDPGANSSGVSPGGVLSQVGTNPSWAWARDEKTPAVARTAKRESTLRNHRQLLGPFRASPEFAVLGEA